MLKKMIILAVSMLISTPLLCGVNVVFKGGGNAYFITTHTHSR